MLKALASAVDAYPPLNRGHPSSFRTPLKLKLHVEPRVPTVAEFRALVELRFPSPLIDFMREKGVHRLADAAALGGRGTRGARVADRRYKESSVSGVAYTHILEVVAERHHKGRLSIVQEASAPRGWQFQS
ncbi:hypothetical protein B0H17DRAFT_1332521 [Mycena rosella]|uniref:Uncharacterized protein n=1 Tax=Mycena rosella TaxID=1033263 RepID=A0AAD7GBU3_MYCRO|nr:hypothetical protein B0H17DRAFT_1332521 [Mycena rosella]